MNDALARPALDWQVVGDYWQAFVPAHELGPRKIGVAAFAYRIYQRSDPDYFELFAWTGDQPEPPATSETGKRFDSLDEAKGEADRRNSWSYFGPYGGVLDGFLVQWRSDIDGDRYLIIDERDYDMTGWTIEVVDDDIEDSWWYQREVEKWGAVPPPRPAAAPRLTEFSRDDGWYDYAGGFRHLGFGDAELRYPWTAFCDHGQHVVRFIPPAANGGR